MYNQFEAGKVFAEPLPKHFIYSCNGSVRNMCSPGIGRTLLDELCKLDIVKFARDVTLQKSNPVCKPSHRKLVSSL